MPKLDSIRVMCPSLVCRKVLVFPKSVRGKTVCCRSCETRFQVPQPSPSVPFEKPFQENGK